VIRSDRSQEPPELRQVPEGIEQHGRNNQPQLPQRGCACLQQEFVSERNNRQEQAKIGD
jgi:hypothetical protein